MPEKTKQGPQTGCPNCIYKSTSFSGAIDPDIVLKTKFPGGVKHIEHVDGAFLEKPWTRARIVACLHCKKKWRVNTEDHGRIGPPWWTTGNLL